VKKFYSILKLFGLDLKTFINSPKGLYLFIKDLLQYRKVSKNNPLPFKISRLYPCLYDRTEQAGQGSDVYFIQDIYFAKKIFIKNPKTHVDIGSSISGFIGHLASFRSVEVFDIRELQTPINNILFKKADLMSFEFNYNNYCDSISCLHALEHFGLGRYGDPIEPSGHLLGFENIYKCLNYGGTFYFSVPIGQLRIEFNAHRIFSINYLLEIINPKYEIVSFSYIDDKGSLYENIDLSITDISNNFGCKFGCGLFTLLKK
jgi:hypothetical protein